MKEIQFFDKVDIQVIFVCVKMFLLWDAGKAR
jgi:hypothetical protein